MCVYVCVREGEKGDRQTAGVDLDPHFSSCMHF